MMRKKITGSIVLSYLERFRNTSSLALARMIFDENPLSFNSVEHARTVVRMYRGRNGNINRNLVTDKRFFGTGQMLSFGEEHKYEPYDLPKANNRILFMSDIHLPFHDLDTIKIALEDAKDKDVNTVILGGDIVDFYTLSVFDQEPHKSTFLHERELFWQLIDDINYYLPNARIIWIEGNHENRFSRYMLRKCAEIYGVDEFSMPSVFHLRELGVDYIDKKRYIRASELNIGHGHEFGQISSMVNPARGMYMRAKDSVVFGHLHRISEHNEPDIRGNVKSCYSVGCLCYLHPQYRPLNSWTNGFALISIHDKGYVVKNKKIVEGKIQ